MAKSRNKFKNRKEEGTFIMVRKDILNHPNYHSLSHRAARLLWDIYEQYNGHNNGDFCATYSVFKQKGWNSNDQFRKALDELKKKGWIVITRYGGLNMGPNLYAVTWKPIDECNGKLDVDSTIVPSNTRRNYSQN
jgi:hypothetical protein